MRHLTLALLFLKNFVAILADFSILFQTVETIQLKGQEGTLNTHD